MGEEWRRGWHPERMPPAKSERPVLVIGAGPAGLEAAQALGKRGYPVVIAEKETRIGGRVTRESGLPGLAAWGRVRDYRELQIRKLVNVEVYLDSTMTADHVLEFGHPRVAVATGSRWRSDGVAHHWTRPLPASENMEVLTPDDIMDGRMPAGRDVVLWDDDHYYMGGVIAERLADSGYGVTLMTTAAEVSTWTRNTMEQHYIQTRLLEKGVDILPHLALEEVGDDSVRACCVFTGRTREIPAAAVVLVTSRQPVDRLHAELVARRDDWKSAGIESVIRIGDAEAPATIAHAVFSGRRYAEALDGPPDTGDRVSFKREIAELLD